MTLNMFSRRDLLALFLGLSSFANSGATVVTTNIDEDDGNLLPTNGSGTSLREAIDYSSWGSTITFAPNLSGQTITLVGNQLFIDKSLTIDASSLPNGITIDGNDNSRVISVFPSIVTLNSLTITGGRSTIFDQGGGIQNFGDLTINNSTISGNTSTGVGGGISSGFISTLTINNSTISDNIAESSGGGLDNLSTNASINNCIFKNNSARSGAGISNPSNAVLTINNSTIKENTAKTSGGGVENSGLLTINTSTLSCNSTLIINNSAIGGGGILNRGFATLIINNSTVSKNSANASGGGIRNDGYLTLNSTTISQNSTNQFGGGIRNGISGTVTLNNSIVANNNAVLGPDIKEDNFVSPTNITITTDGVNLLSDLSSSELFSSSAVLVGAPLLAPLSDYGGLTQTMPPLPGSPAIDSATFDSEISTDQRGLPRPNGTAPDVGAVEAFPFSTIPLVDTDHDGLDDRLEEGFFEDLVTAGETTDFDGDGSLDINELGNMTNPKDATSILRITSLVKSSNFTPEVPTFDLTFTSFPGIRYRLKQNSSLQGNFTNLKSPIVVGNTTSFGGLVFAHDSTTTREVTLDPGRDFIQVTRE